MGREYLQMPGVLANGDEHGVPDSSSDDNSLLESYCSEGKFSKLINLCFNLNVIVGQ